MPRCFPAAPGRALRAALLLLLTALALAGRAEAAPLPAAALPLLLSAPPPRGAPRDAWRAVLDALWERWRGDIGFCVGSSQAKVERLAELSYQWPLPVTTGDDGVCGNRTLIERHLCSAQEIALWYQVRARAGARAGPGAGLWRALQKSEII